jgi:hypothetical protein
MRSIAGPRPLDRWSKAEAPSRRDVGGHILLPRPLVEIDGKEPAGLILQEWVHSCDVAPLKVIEQHLIRDRHERLVRARTTLDPWLLAHPTNPLIGAGRSVSPLLRLGVLPELGKDIRPADEQRAKERHLFTLGPRRPF